MKQNNGTKLVELYKDKDWGFDELNSLCNELLISAKSIVIAINKYNLGTVYLHDALDIWNELEYLVGTLHKVRYKDDSNASTETKILIITKRTLTIEAFNVLTNEIKDMMRLKSIN